MNMRAAFDCVSNRAIVAAAFAVVLESLATGRTEDPERSTSLIVHPIPEHTVSPVLLDRAQLPEEGPGHAGDRANTRGLVDGPSGHGTDWDLPDTRSLAIALRSLQATSGQQPVLHLEVKASRFVGLGPVVFVASLELNGRSTPLDVERSHRLARPESDGEYRTRISLELVDAGEYRVRVTPIVAGVADPRFETRCRFLVMDVPLSDVQVNRIRLIPVERTRDQDRLPIFWVNTSYLAEVETSPPEFSTLAEWGTPAGVIGRGNTPLVFERGEVTTLFVDFAARRLAERRMLALDTVVDSKPSIEQVLAGAPVTYLAHTIPAGFEDYIHWFTDTKGGMAGSVRPTIGQGADFTCTWSLVPVGPHSYWFRIQANETVLGGDVQAPKALCVRELTFDNIHDVAKDPDGIDYVTPHWLDVNLDCDASDCNEHRFPVAYVRNTMVVVKEVRIRTNRLGQNLVVKGTAINGDVFMGPGAIQAGEIVANNLVASAALPNTVKFYNPYSIIWEVSFNGGPFCPAGATDNRMYVTLAAPTATPLYETACELSCGAADGEAAAANVVADVWAQFTDLDVRRKPLDGFNKTDGVRMGYWRPPPGVCQSLAEMLASPIGNGACGAWADLLIACIKVHGIGGAVFTTVTADAAVNAGADGFLVKNWAFATSRVLSGANGVHQSALAGDDVNVYPNGNGFPSARCISPGPNSVINSATGGDDTKIGDEETNTGPNGVTNTTSIGDDVQVIPVGQGLANSPCILPGANGVINSMVGGDDAVANTALGGGLYPYTVNQNALNLPGIPGQDNPEPPPAFFNHFIVRYGGMLYDPSYGAGPFGAELAHENAAIDGIRSLGMAKTNAAAQELDYNP